MKQRESKHTKSLTRFLKLIPNQIYHDSKIDIQNNQDIYNLTHSFILLASKDPKLVQNIIATYIKEDKKLVDQNKLNPNAMPN